MEKILKIFSFIFVCILMSGCAHYDNIERKTYNSWEKDIGYSQVVKVGDTLYISGITSEAITFDGQLVQIYETIGGILKDYGTDTSSIVKEVVYTKDIEALKNAIPVRKKYFKENQFPAATWVQIDRLYMPDHFLEIEVVVYIPKK